MNDEEIIKLENNNKMLELLREKRVKLRKTTLLNQKKRRLRKIKKLDKVNIKGIFKGLDVKVVKLNGKFIYFTGQRDFKNSLRGFYPIYEKYFDLFNLTNKSGQGAYFQPTELYRNWEEFKSINLKNRKQVKLSREVRERIAELTRIKAREKSDKRRVEKMSLYNNINEKISDLGIQFILSKGVYKLENKKFIKSSDISEEPFSDDKNNFTKR